MDNSARFLVVALVLSLIAGIGIVIFNEDYRVPKILESNKNFYPNAAGSKPAGGNEGY